MCLSVCVCVQGCVWALLCGLWCPDVVPGVEDGRMDYSVISHGYSCDSVLGFWTFFFNVSWVSKAYSKMIILGEPEHIHEYFLFAFFLLSCLWSQTNVRVFSFLFILFFSPSQLSSTLCYDEKYWNLILWHKKVETMKKKVTGKMKTFSICCKHAMLDPPKIICILKWFYDVSVLYK